jgi:hypothetical protein
MRKVGLPDCLSSNQKFRFGQILEGLAMEVAGILYVHLVYFMAIWYTYFVMLWYFFGKSFPRFCTYVAPRNKI